MMNGKRKLNENLATIAASANAVNSEKKTKNYNDDKEVNRELAVVCKDGTSQFGEGVKNIPTSPKWSRSDPPKFNPETDAFVFQQICLDNYVQSPLPGMPGSTVVRMYGNTMDGNSVCCHVHGFCPYFYLAAPQNFEHHHCKDLLDALNEKRLPNKQQMKNIQDNIKEAVLEVKIDEHLNIYGYHNDGKQRYIKITVSKPEFITAVAGLLKNEIISSFNFCECRTFEDTIDFDIRFMVETGVVGCNWIELPAGTWRMRNQNTNPLSESHCQIEVDVAFDKFISHKPEGEWSKMAPFRILSFDIECAGRKGIFPNAKFDPVIQIANMVIRYGDPEPFIRNVFTLKTCASIVGSEVLCFDKETDLLAAWVNFLREVDPDIITGYNINDFDFPYLLNRASHLEVKNFDYLGRIKNMRSVVKDKMLQTKKGSRFEKKYVTFEGRIPFDLLFVLLRDYKLHSYRLNDVSYHFLEEQKDDVHYSIITDLQNGDEQTRRRLAMYCLKDAYLPLRLLDKLELLVNYMETARLTGVKLESLLFRGHQIKVVTQLLRKARINHSIMPPYSSSNLYD